jgi:hypothetical protein
MLTESEQRFEKTGRYHGVERLTMQAEDPDIASTSSATTSRS